MASSTPPKKYIKINGVMKKNPEYTQWQNAQNPSPSAPPPFNAALDQALPVVSSMADHEELNEIVVAGGGHEIPLAESTNATIEMMQEPEISLAAGMTADTMVDELGSVLNKYEIPMGLMNKLLMLTEYQVLEFLIDDSGSMSLESDTKDPVTGRMQTRWREAQVRLKEMVEILAYVPFEAIEICFLNRTQRLRLTRNGRDPQSFLQDAHRQIDAAFAAGPSGTTPVMERMQDSFLHGQGKRIARYFFGDGVPNGGERAKQEMLNLIKNRVDPEGNPVTFISCTNEDEAVEWMKDIEEVAPYCSESDDYQDEMQEVLRDQGVALPYTRGFHLICQLVAAMNPDDLDAMDESIPFTKATLDNLLGIQHDEASYRYYFNAFEDAQRKRSIQGKSDELKKNTKWNYSEFLRAPMARDIAQARDLKEKLARLN